VLTSSHAEADLVRALDAGVDGYLCKECSVADLVRALREVYEGGFYAGPWAAGAMRTRSTASAGATLTSREIEVLCSLQCGHTTEEIAAQLLLSPSSVKTHLGNIYRKLDARNRVEALHEATRRGIIGD
jgi:DNA-binding NarL/FixJ family response regulator